jgi:two-component system cell cycle response regulator CtrA
MAGLFLSRTAAERAPTNCATFMSWMWGDMSVASMTLDKPNPGNPTEQVAEGFVNHAGLIVSHNYIQFDAAAFAIGGKAYGMRVLLIEDDLSTTESIELMLKAEDFNVYTTDLGEEGVDLGKLYDYEIILLDLNLPDMPGLEVLRALRISKVKTPIMVLSGLAGIEGKCKALGLGADDYMTKPFHKDELVARIQAIVRRSSGHAQSVIQTGDLIVNLDAKNAEIRGSQLNLTVKEFQILELLSLRRGTPVTKEIFLNQLYGGLDEPQHKIIDVFICKLRKKIADASGKQDYIETIWGRGYALQEPSDDKTRIPA